MFEHDENRFVEVGQPQPEQAAAPLGELSPDGHARAQEGQQGAPAEAEAAGKGSEVNGTRVTEAVLGAGDRIRVGGCVLEVEVDEARA